MLTKFTVLYVSLSPLSPITPSVTHRERNTKGNPLFSVAESTASAGQAAADMTARFNMQEKPQRVSISMNTNAELERDRPGGHDHERQRIREEEEEGNSPLLSKRLQTKPAH